MKNPTPQRAIASSAVQLGAKRNQVMREHIPLRNLPDCLLAAYDGVSRRAFERFVARGSKAGNEIADWRTAETDMLLPVAVDLQDTEGALYALATVTGMSASQIAVAIEDRWLLISGHVEPQAEREGNLPPNKREEGQLAVKWIDWDDLYSVLHDSEDAGGLVCSENTIGPAELNGAVKSRPFCVVELPVEVDVARTVAVLSDGVIAIRMPKIVAEIPESIAASS
jgi:HSP20 family molecular chaperone IbpA